MSAPEIRARVGRIDLKPGESLTVWLDSARRPGERNAAQVGLRVRLDGVREVFFRPDGQINVRDFDNWRTA